MASNVLKQLLVRFGADFGGLDKDLEKLNNKLKHTGDRLTGIGKELSLKLTAPLVAAGAFALKSAADMEQLEVAFTTMLGSADDAKRVLEELNQFAAETPFDFPELADAARKLIAFGVSADDLQDELRALGDVSAGVGMSINEIAEIYGKAKVQGQIFAEDINQLTGRGIPIIQELAKQFGVTEGEVKKLVQTGQVGFANIQQAFKDLTSEGGKFSGLMAAQSETLGGVFGSLQDNVMMTLTVIGNKIVETFDLKNVIAKVDELTQKIRTFAESHPKLTTLAVVIGTVTAAVGPLLVGIGSLLKLLPLMTSAIRVLTTTALGPWGLAIAGITAAVVYLWANWDEIWPALERTWYAVTEAVLTAADKILGALEKIYGWIPGFGDAITMAREKLAEMIDAAKIKKDAVDAERALKDVEDQSGETAGAADELAASTTAVGDAMGGTAGASDEHRKRLAAIRDIYTGLAEDTEKLKNKQLVLGPSFNAAKEEVRLLETAMIDLLNAGVSPTDEGFLRLRRRANDLTAEMDALAAKTEIWKEAQEGVSDVIIDNANELDEYVNAHRRLAEGIIIDNTAELEASIAALEPISTGFFSRFTENMQKAFVGDGGALSVFNAVGGALAGPGGLGATITAVLSASGPWGQAIATGLALLKKFGIDVEDILGGIERAFNSFLDSIGFGTSAVSDEDVQRVLGQATNLAERLKNQGYTFEEIRDALRQHFAEFANQPGGKIELSGIILEVLSKLFPDMVGQRDGGPGAIPTPRGSEERDGDRGRSGQRGPREMAMGGIVMPRAMGTLARLAEAGSPEAVVPLDARGMQFMRQAIGTGRMGDVVVQIDGREIARASLPHIPRELRMMGAG